MWKLVIIDGIYGSGKSSLCSKLVDVLHAMGIDAFVTSDFTATDDWIALRERLVSGELDADESVILINQVRKLHFEKVIKPAIECWKFVICDMFTSSTWAYQVIAGGANHEFFSTRENIMGGLWPQAVEILIDIPVEVAMARAASRGKLDTIESKPASFHHEIDNALKSIIQKRFWIDGTQSTSAMSADALRRIFY